MRDVSGMESSELIMELESYAEDGALEASRFLSRLYRNGKIVPPDKTREYRFRCLRCIQGDESMCWYMYLKKEPIRRGRRTIDPVSLLLDINEGNTRKWLSRLADQGDGTANDWLRWLLDEDLGIGKSDRHKSRIDRRSLDGSREPEQWMRDRSWEIVDELKTRMGINVEEPSSENCWGLLNTDDDSIQTITEDHAILFGVLSRQ